MVRLPLRSTEVIITDSYSLFLLGLCFLLYLKELHEVLQLHLHIFLFKHSTLHDRNTNIDTFTLPGEIEHGIRITFHCLC